MVRRWTLNSRTVGSSPVLVNFYQIVYFAAGCFVKMMHFAYNLIFKKLSSSLVFANSFLLAKAWETRISGVFTSVPPLTSPVRETRGRGFDPGVLTHGA